MLDTSSGIILYQDHLPKNKIRPLIYICVFYSQNRKPELCYQVTPEGQTNVWNNHHLMHWTACSLLQ